MALQAETSGSADAPKPDSTAEEQLPASNACENLPSTGLLPGDAPSGGQQVVSKLLISNAAAGSVIGKVHAIWCQLTENRLLVRPCSVHNQQVMCIVTGRQHY